MTTRPETEVLLSAKGEYVPSQPPKEQFNFIGIARCGELNYAKAGYRGFRGNKNRM